MDARVSRKATVSGLIGKLVQHVFDGSARRLVAHLVQEGELDDREREELVNFYEQRQRRKTPREEGRHLMNL